jgi:hypothetical protein
MAIAFLCRVDEIELTLTWRLFDRGGRRFDMLLIFGHANVFAWPMRPLAKIARHIPPWEIAFLPIH